MKLADLHLLCRLAAFTLPWCLSTLSAGAAVVQQPKAAPLSISGTGFVIGKLDNGAKAFTNRSYVWFNVPAKFAGWQFTEIKGGKIADLTVRAFEDTNLYIATNQAAPEGWEPVDGGVFSYSDKYQTTMRIYGRRLNEGTVLPIPQGGWSGTLVLAPALSGVANPRVVKERMPAIPVNVAVQPVVQPATVVVVQPDVVVTKVHKHHHSDRKAEHRAAVAMKKAQRAYNHQIAAQRRYAAAHAPTYRRATQHGPIRRVGH